MAIDFAKLLRDGPGPDPVVPSVVLGITGHRPDKLWSRREGNDHDGYEWGNPLRVALRERIREATARLIAVDHGPRRRALWIASHLKLVQWRTPQPTGPLCVTGGALGIDQDAAGVWARMGVPYIVAVPFPGQESRWPADSQRRYRAMLDRAAGIVEVSKVSPGNDSKAAARMLHERNLWIACISDEMIGVHDGSSGGTAHCVRERRRMGAGIEIIDPVEVREALGKGRSERPAQVKTLRLWPEATQLEEASVEVFGPLTWTVEEEG